jgi:hypothetical protein
MADSMQAEGVEPWIAEQDLRQVAGGGVPFADDGDISFDCLEHRAK